MSRSLSKSQTRPSRAQVDGHDDVIDQLRPDKSVERKQQVSDQDADDTQMNSPERKGDQSLARKMSKIKKNMSLKGDPTLDQMKYGLNLQDRMDQNERKNEIKKEWKATYDRTDGRNYIRPDTVEPKQERKRLKSAVNSEARSVGNPNSRFIEQNMSQFQNVSKLNLRRAE